MSSVSIRKRKKKKGFSYQLVIDYSNNHTDMDYITFDTNEEAKAAKTELEMQFKQGSFIKICKYTFAEVLDKWQSGHADTNCDDDTSYGYSLIVKKYLKPVLGHIPIQNLNVEIINNYFHYIRLDEDGPHLSYETAKNHKTCISGSLKYAVTNRWIKENICSYSTIPKTEEDKAEDYIDDISDINDIDDLNVDKKKAITPQQAILVLNIFYNSCMLLPVALAMFLNLRRSEICGILKTKINKDKKIILINAVVTRGKNGLKFKKKNKSKKSRRPYYIPNILMEIIELDEKRKQENREMLGDKYIESDYLCTLDNGTPIKPDYLSRHFTEELNKYIAKEKEKNPDFKFPEITLHGLRHFNITFLIENDINLADVRDSAGHADIQTTMRYTHVYSENKKKIADKIDEVFTPLLNSSNF